MGDRPEYQNLGKKVGEDGDQDIVEFTESELMQITVEDLITVCKDNNIPLDGTGLRAAFVRHIMRST